MTVYEIPNIEHCTVEEMGNPVFAYRICSKEGWYIHLAQAERPIYKGAVALRYDFDFSTVQIVAEADLPPDAEICAEVGKPETE